MVKLAKIKNINNKILDKLIALTIGFFIWTIFCQSSLKNVWLEVPLCFYNTNDNIICKGPESIKINLVAKRENLKNLDQTNLAVHIDAQKLTENKSFFQVSEQDLLLPASIKLVNYTPSNIIVSAENKVCQTSSEQTV